MNNYKDPDYMKKWREANRERLRQYQRQYEKDTAFAATRKWHKNHPVEASLHRKVNAANQRYDGHLTVAQLREVIDRVGKKCHWCGKENLSGRDFTLEHLKPVNDPEFLTISCRSCNCSRKHKPSNKMSVEELKKRKIFFSNRYRLNLTGDKLADHKKKNLARFKSWYAKLTPEQRHERYLKYDKDRKKVPHGTWLLGT